MNKFSHERARSLRIVQIVFGVLALFSLIAALAVSSRGADLGLPEASILPISLAFLIVGVVDTALLFVWEHIAQRIEF